ncbi:hypothetical protein V9T40_014758 [Parthenolecanium corni]|uniref:Uncharacterized protein n=1 Tax=Parthenolecanium corni TaxID=536013 RepID=A0AAN9T4H4_9HEMI
MYFVILFSLVAFKLHVQGNKEIGLGSSPQVVGFADCTNDKCLRHHFVNVTNKFDMDQSYGSGQFQGLPGRSAPIAQSANYGNHSKNVDVHWSKYSFIRRVRKDVLQQATNVEDPIFSRQPANGDKIPSVRLESVNKEVNSTFAMVPAKSGDRSFIGVEPVVANGRSTFALKALNEDSKALVGIESANAGANSGFALQPVNAASSSDSKLEPASGSGSSNMRQLNQLQLFHSLSNSGQNSAIERRPQNVDVISSAKDAIAGAQVPSILEKTAGHFNSVAAAIQIPKVLPSADQLRLQQNSDERMAAKAEAPQKLITSNHTFDSSTSSANLSDDEFDDTKKLGPGIVSSNSKTFKLDPKPLHLAEATKVGADEGTNFQKNDSKMWSNESVIVSESFDRLVQPQPAADIRVPSNQSSAFWNPFAVSNDSSTSNPKAVANSANRSDKLPSSTNTSSSESNSAGSDASSDPESVSSEENSTNPGKINHHSYSNISSVQSSNMKNILEAEKTLTKDGFNALPLPSESTFSAPLSSVKIKIGDVIEATYEGDSKLYNSVGLDHDAAYTKNLTGTPDVPSISDSADEENHQPTYLNLSCTVQGFPFSNAMHQILNLTQSPTAVKASAEVSPTLSNQEPPSPHKLLSNGKMATTEQQRALSANIIAYYPLIMVPWVLVPRFPGHLAQQNVFKFPSLQHDGNRLSQTITAAEAKPTKENLTTSTSTSKPWTYIPNTHFSDILVMKKNESGKAHQSQFVQLLVPSLFYMGESFTFLPPTKNIQEDTKKKNSLHR